MVCFASIAVVTTGSELWTIRSNGVISLFEEIVEPDCASLNPETNKPFGPDFPVITVLDWINSHNTFDCKIDNQSDNYSLLAVQGPQSIELLQELTDVNLTEIKYYNFKTGSIAGVEDVILSRTGYTGEIGFELYVRNEDARTLWEAVFSTKIQMKAIGLAARDTLRLEKGFCLYGNEINDTTSPIEEPFEPIELPLKIVPSSNVSTACVNL